MQLDRWQNPSSHQEHRPPAPNQKVPGTGVCSAYSILSVFGSSLPTWRSASAHHLTIKDASCAVLPGSRRSSRIQGKSCGAAEGIPRSSADRRPDHVLHLLPSSRRLHTCEVKHPACVVTDVEKTWISTRFLPSHLVGPEEPCMTSGGATSSKSTR